MMSRKALARCASALKAAAVSGRNQHGISSRSISATLAAAVTAMGRHASVSKIAVDPLLVNILRHGMSASDMWPSTQELFKGVLAGDRASLAKAITLVESLRDDHRRQAELLLDAVLQARNAVNLGAAGSSNRSSIDDGLDAATIRELKRREKLGLAGPQQHEAKKEGEVELDDTGHPLMVVPHNPAAIPPTFRIGIAGPPGAGKSTTIEALGMYAISQGHRVAVVAVDPSSTRSGGSILGDKTRMPELSRAPAAYVRPSPTRGALGGLAEHTNDVILLCEGCGFDIVLVETVGLGQSEVAIDTAVDMLLLVVPPAGGDELQGVKKGIVEVADAVIINKSDPDSPLANAAAHSQAEYRRALQLVRWKHDNPAGVWVPPVGRCSALTGWGIPDVWAICSKFRQRVGGAGVIAERRRRQASEWMWSGLASQLMAAAKGCGEVQSAAQSLAPSLAMGGITPRRAAHSLVTEFMRASAVAVGEVKQQQAGAVPPPPTT